MMDTIADNLSNVNTTGYKSETPEFQTLLYQDGIQPGAQSTGQTVYPPAWNSAPASRPRRSLTY